jgi:sporulation-control protein
MGFFKNVLAAIGIGGTKVDTILFDSSVQVGGKLKGEVQITGGTVAQQIKEIFLVLNTKVEKESNDQKYYVTVPVHRVHIPLSVEIKPSEKQVVPFEMTIPLHTPLSFGKVRLWVQTEAEILSGVDAQDQDMIKITPHPAQRTVLEALQQLGFTLRNSDNEHSYYAKTGFEQEFEYFPSPEFRGYLDELEVAFDLSESQLLVKLTIDRKARGLGSFLAEMAGADDRRVHVTFSLAELQMAGVSGVAQHLRDVIHKYKK